MIKDNPNQPVVVFGNKSDLEGIKRVNTSINLSIAIILYHLILPYLLSPDQREVTTKEAKEKASKLGCVFVETSAKSK